MEGRLQGGHLLRVLHPVPQGQGHEEPELQEPEESKGLVDTPHQGRPTVDETHPFDEESSLTEATHHQEEEAEEQPLPLGVRYHLYLCRPQVLTPS